MYSLNATDLLKRVWRNDIVTGQEFIPAQCKSDELNHMLQ